MNPDKPTIMICGEDASTHSGLARVVREIFNRIHKTDKYNLVQVAFGGPGVEPVNWRIHHNKRNTKGETDPDDRYGEQTFVKYFKHYKPDIVWGFGDPWNIAHLGDSELRTAYDLVIYTCIDSEPMHPRMKPIYDQATKVVTFGSWPQQVLKDSYNVDSEIIPHGVDLDKFKRDLSKRSIVRAELSLTEEDILVGTIARNQPRKNLLQMPKVMHYMIYGRYLVCQDCKRVTKDRLNPSTCNVRFEYQKCRHCGSTNIIRGKGDKRWKWYYHGALIDIEPWHLEGWSQRYKLHGNVIFNKDIAPSRGLLDKDLTGIYNAFDIFATPTTCEGFGLPIAEAMSCEIPVVAANYSAHTDWAGKGGILVDYHEYFEPRTQHIRALPTTEDFIRALTQLTKPMTRENYGLAGRKEMEKYSWDNIVEKWVHLFDNVLANKSPNNWHRTLKI